MRPHSGRRRLPRAATVLKRAFGPTHGTDAEKETYESWALDPSRWTLITAFLKQAEAIEARQDTETVSQETPGTAELLLDWLPSNLGDETPATGAEAADDDAKSTEEIYMLGERPRLEFHLNGETMTVPIAVWGLGLQYLEQNHPGRVLQAISRPDQITVALPVWDEFIPMVNTMLSEYIASATAKGNSVTSEDIGDLIDRALGISSTQNKLMFHIGAQVMKGLQDGAQTVIDDIIAVHNRLMVSRDG